jgi:hypothetical protein
MSRAEEDGAGRSPLVEECVKALVRAWLDGPDDHGLGHVVRETGALPVYADIGGTLFIRPDGTVLCLVHDSDGPPQIERDPRWRLSAYAVGAEKYPDLLLLLPKRGATATDCQSCGGRGRIMIREIEIGCLHCGGLGWQTDGAAVEVPMSRPGHLRAMAAAIRRRLSTVRPSRATRDA